MQRRLSGRALCRLLRALQAPGSVAEAAPLTAGLQAAARPCSAPAEWPHAPLACSASTQWQATRVRPPASVLSHIVCPLAFQ
jgi:hypothetical protein